MSAIALPASLVARPRRLSRHGPTTLVLLACAAFMFVDVRTPPVALWDESRIAVNALEMHLSGCLSLVTTYGFAPDLWNTKPPLLIWLMDLSMDLFGVSEWAMRLPSMLAAMGTLTLVLSFVRRVGGSFWTGTLAAGLLAASIVFFGEHGARTADYEALLCLFTTGYLYVLFFALHRRRPGWRAPLVAGGLIGLAVMTKSVAGLMPGLGVPLYLLWVGRVRRPFQAPWLLGATPLALGPAAVFYALREVAAPGYLHAVAYNDLSGRYARALDRHGGGPLYYFDGLLAGGAFAGGWSPVLALAAMVWARGRTRLGLLYSLCVAMALLGVLSFSATKLRHYAAPAAPWLAIATALALQSSFHKLRIARCEGRIGAVGVRVATVATAAFLLLALDRSVLFRTRWLPAHEFQPQALYEQLIADAPIAAPGLDLVDGGVVGRQVVAEGLPAAYAPQLDFYRERAVARGQAVRRIAPQALTYVPTQTLVGTCDARDADTVLSLGDPLAAPTGCVLVRRR